MVKDSGVHGRVYKKKGGDYKKDDVISEMVGGGVVHIT